MKQAKRRILVTGLLAAAMWLAVEPVAVAVASAGRFTGPKSGFALYYTDRAMERVGRVRIRQGLITHIRRDVAGYTAVTDCSKIGWIAYLSLNGGSVKRYQILDCSHPAHVAWHVRHGRVAETNENATRRAGCIWRSGETMGRCPARLVDIRRN